MAYSLLIGGGLVAVVGAPAMLHQDWGRVGGAAWAILAFAIVGPVYIAYALWNWAIGKRGIPRTVVFGFLVPVLAGALAVLALHERAHPEQVVGALLVVSGLVITRLGSRAAPVPVPEPASEAVSKPGAHAQTAMRGGLRKSRPSSHHRLGDEAFGVLVQPAAERSRPSSRSSSHRQPVPAAETPMRPRRS